MKNISIVINLAILGVISWALVVKDPVVNVVSKKYKVKSSSKCRGDAIFNKDVLQYGMVFRTHTYKLCNDISLTVSKYLDPECHTIEEVLEKHRYDILGYNVEVYGSTAVITHWIPREK